MKRWTYLIAVLFITAAAQAQYYGKESGFLLGINAGYSYPTGDFGKVAKGGLGGSISAKYLINRVIGIGFEAGYYSFKQGGDLEIESPTQTHSVKYKLIPLLFETTFYIPTWDRKLLPYIGLHFGGYLANVDINQQDSNNPDRNAKENIYRFSPGIGPHAGILIELSEFFKLDLKLRGDYVMKIKSEYDINEYTKGEIGFDKMLNLGANIGLLYTF